MTSKKRKLCPCKVYFSFVIKKPGSQEKFSYFPASILNPQQIIHSQITTVSESLNPSEEALIRISPTAPSAELTMSIHNP